jgi:hypothetical protein
MVRVTDLINHQLTRTVIVVKICFDIFALMAQALGMDGRCQNEGACSSHGVSGRVTDFVLLDPLRV